MESSFVKHINCENCGSSDANSLYSDGHTHCFSCGHTTKKSEKSMSKKSTILRQTRVSAINQRKISKSVCQHFEYHVGEFEGNICHVEQYFDDSNNLVAQKLRFQDKSKGFPWLGEYKKASLFGKQQARQCTRSKIYITEGALDAMSIAETLGTTWAVVSIKNGADGALKNLKDELQFIEEFNEIILCFDNDEPGKKATTACATLFSPGKVKITNFGKYKDANEVLMNESQQALKDILYRAEVWHPDNIHIGEQLFEDIKNKPVLSDYTYPFDFLNAKTYGLRKGEIVTLTAGSGIGKSTIAKEIAYNLISKHDLKVGFISLEEPSRKVALGLMGLHLNTPLAIKEVNSIDDISLLNTYDKIIKTKFVGYDGLINENNLSTMLRYLVKGLDCDFVVLDHISMIVSGISDGDERRLIDNMMTTIRQSIVDMQYGMILISHLARSNKTPHEEGGNTSLSQLRGSGAIGQISDMVIGVERNQQDEEHANLLKMRLLKNRFCGITGVAGYVSYDLASGRLKDVSASSNKPQPKQQIKYDEDESPF